MKHTVGTLLQNLFHNLRNYFLFLYFYLSTIKNSYLNNEKITEISSINDENEYIKKRTKEFQRIFESPNYNQTINPIFYNKSVYDEYMNQETNTKLEEQWKLRILFEYTPRGNVYMYYDPYKMGFKYYSDQKTISYDLLNACAMKYVKLFQCRDFFMDEYHLNNYTNPLIKLHYGIDLPKKTKTTTQMSGPFIKRTIHESKEQIKIIETEKNKNKFLYVGKLSNTTFLNIPTKIKNTGFRSALLDGLEENAKVQNQIFSYKDFKNSKLDLKPSATSKSSATSKPSGILTIEGTLDFSQD